MNIHRIIPDAGTRLLKSTPTRDEAAEKCPDAGQGKLL